MTKITAVIVEDSRLARAELKELLKNHPQIDIIGEAENVDKAYKIIQEKNPALLFLDINMPEKDGFELLELLDKIPLVVFTTAYDEYAIKSFEYNAFDYLLKPISATRFAKTINKLIPLLKDKETQTTSKKLITDDQIFIKEGEKCWMVALKDISLFEIMGNYTRVFFEDEKPLIYKSLNQIETQLPNDFFRVNRQQIIRLKSIDKVTPWFNGKLKITLFNGVEVETSRRQALKFRQHLEL
ncbi:MAG: LytTR family DNA-binding domain-containing protein [Flavobacteriaceae bacterium]